MAARPLAAILRPGASPYAHFQPHLEPLKAFPPRGSICAVTFADAQIYLKMSAFQRAFCAIPIAKVTGARKTGRCAVSEM